MTVSQQDAVLVSMRAGAVSASFRLEWSLLDIHRESQAAHHLVEHVIVLITQPLGADLQRDMPIA